MLNNIIEALLFAAGDGLAHKTIIESLSGQFTTKEIELAIIELKKEYSGDKGIHLIEYNAKYQFQTNSDYGTIISDALKETREKELSKTLLRTLSIIAYKQPITRLEIEDMRGANADYALGMLLKHNLIEPKGRKESLGSPILYGTTDEFLRKFGMESLSELPDYEELMVKIRDNYERFHQSSGLYREHSIDPLAEAMKVAATVAPDYDDDDEDDDEIPKFLEDEDFIEEESD